MVRLCDGFREGGCERTMGMNAIISNAKPAKSGSRAASTAHHHFGAETSDDDRRDGRINLVPTVDFAYPDEDDEPEPVVRDEWRSEPALIKCQRRFAPIHSGHVLTAPLLDKRLEVLQFALRDAVEQMDVAAICRLAGKARTTAERIAAEQIAGATPASREIHDGIVIHDDADRGKVLIQFTAPVDRGTRRWLKMCGFCGSGDGATYWRRRTFRRGENLALDHARHCVERILEQRAKISAAERAAFVRDTAHSLCA